MALFKMSLVSVLVFCGIAFSKAQDLELLDQEFNIWAPEEPEAAYEAQLALQTLCENYNFVVDSRQIDCSNILLTARPKDAEYVHSISRRDAEEPEEGSGNEPAIESEAQPESNQNEAEKSEEAAVGGSILSAREPSPDAPHEDNANDTGAVENEEEPKNPDVAPEASQNNTAKPEEVPNVEAEEKPQEQYEDKVEEPAPEENEDNKNVEENPEKPEEPVQETEDSKNDESEVKEQNKEDSEAAAAEKEAAKAEAIPVNTASGNNQEGSVEKVLPSDLAEVNSTHTKEDIIEEQSANAALLKPVQETPSNGVEVSESEKAVRKLAEKANEEVQKDSNAPNTGESTVQRGSKSTAVLLVLLVVVLVIGAAIFIRKYTGSKNKNKEPVTTNGKNGDIEQGQELKPLMKDGTKASPVKEYSENSKGTKY